MYLTSPYRDRLTYEKLITNRFPAYLNYKLSFAFESSLLTKKEYEYLKVADYNTPIIYILPKVHKSLDNPPGRPIISAIKGPLKNIVKHIDALLKVMVVELTSYVQDTRNMLAKIQGIEVPPGTLLVGIDVESLYTSIPHEWGLAAMSYFLDKSFPHMGSQN